MKPAFHSFYVQWGGRQRFAVELQTAEWGFDLRVIVGRHLHELKWRPR